MPTGPRLPHRVRPARRSVGLLAVALLLVAVAGSCSEDEVDPLITARPYELHLPPDHQNRERAPLLVLLHGYGQTASLVTQYFDMFPATDAHRMIVAAPEGTVDERGKQYWHATAACCGPADSTVDDVAYLRAVVEDVRRQYLVDPTRIYFMGHSNGGFMSYKMACEASDIVAAVISLNGAMTVGEPCDPTEPVAAVEIHGTGDEIILYAGGDWKESSAAYMGAADSAQAWQKINGCDPAPEQPPPAGHEIAVGLPPVEVTAYGDCRPGGRAELWSQPGANHQPELTPGFGEATVGFLLGHPKP